LDDYSFLIVVATNSLLHIRQGNPNDLRGLLPFKEKLFI